MNKNLLATIVSGTLFLFLLAGLVFLNACGSVQKTETQLIAVDSQRCYVVEFTDTQGGYHTIPASDIAYMYDMGSGWFIWLDSNTGWYGVDVTGYGKDPDC